MRYEIREWDCEGEWVREEFDNLKDAIEFYKNEIRGLIFDECEEGMDIFDKENNEYIEI